MTMQNVRKSGWFAYGLPLLLLLGLLLQGCVPAAGPAAQESASEEAADGPAANVNVYGMELPADARPYDEQVYRVAYDINQSASTFDFSVAVYNRYCLSDLFQDTLVSLDKDFNVIPAAAESWEVSENGKVWTFNLRPGQVWSDGTPLTAYDYEATFRLTATPDHGWDFSWSTASWLMAASRTGARLSPASCPPKSLACVRWMT